MSKTDREKERKDERVSEKRLLLVTGTSCLVSNMNVKRGSSEILHERGNGVDI